MIEISYGDDVYEDRTELRGVVWNIAQGRCEHPVDYLHGGGRKECAKPATELAHIQPRGMGHQGDRDTVNNAIAACTLHARSTDDLSSYEWDNVPKPHDRQALRDWVLERRRKNGWAV